MTIDTRHMMTRIWYCFTPVCCLAHAREVAYMSYYWSIVIDSSISIGIRSSIVCLIVVLAALQYPFHITGDVPGYGAP